MNVVHVYMRLLMMMIDTQVVIPDCLTELVHKLADNMHQNWAKTKITNGFRYGPVRKREAKRVRERQEIQ